MLFNKEKEDSILFFCPLRYFFIIFLFFKSFNLNFSFFHFFIDNLMIGLLQKADFVEKTFDFD
jgi:hypothetical protein